MHRRLISGTLVALGTSALLLAQDNRVFLDEARQAYREVADNVVSSAVEMAPANYAFRPADGSRSFGELLIEVVRSQDNLCSAIAGRELGRNEPRLGTKEDVIAALRNSNRACETAYASVTAFNAASQSGWGRMRQSKLGLMFLNTARNSELYGHLAVYLRLKGLLPPTERARVVPLD